MKTLHTPGPWTDAIGMAGRPIVSSVNQSTDIIAVMSRSGKTQEEAYANARLIAAAPDMLAALQECITEDGANCLAYGTDTPKLRARLRAINETARAAIAKSTQ